MGKKESCYFHHNAKRSYFMAKVRMFFIMVGLLYYPNLQETHALTLVLNLIDTSLSPFHSLTATFLS